MDKSLSIVIMVCNNVGCLYTQTAKSKVHPPMWLDTSIVHCLRAHAKITSHFRRRCILPGSVVKGRNMLDIPALSRLAIQAPRHLKSVN